GLGSRAPAPQALRDTAPAVFADLLEERLVGRALPIEPAKGLRLGGKLPLPILPTVGVTHHVPLHGPSRLTPLLGSDPGSRRRSQAQGHPTSMRDPGSP